MTSTRGVHEPSGIVPDWLAAAADEHPDRTVLISGERSWSYRTLLDARTELAARLTAYGVRRGDRVGVLLPNSNDYVCLLHALIHLGAVSVLLNTRLTDLEIRHQIERAECKLVLTDRVGDGYTALDELSGLASDPLPADEFRPNREDDVLVILFTSGTTGTPKAAQLTHGNFAASAHGSNARLGFRPDDRWLLCLPLYHVGGLSIVLRCAQQATCFVLSESRIDVIAAALHQHEITHVSLVPTQLYRLILSGFVPPASMRCALIGGAAASAQLLEMAAARGIPVSTTYGMTEATSQIATMPPERVSVKPGSVGKPLDGTLVRVIDDVGNDQPPMAYGEIEISGPTVMKGYLGQPETGGLFRTGDIGYLDHEGDLWLVQRRSDLIVSGGENVYPAEVEKVLRASPLIEDACVVGVPHREWGEQVTAAIVARAGMEWDAQSVDAFVRQRLAGYKVPRQYLVLEALPMTASGKIERQTVRRIMLEAFS